MSNLTVECAHMVRCPGDPVSWIDRKGHVYCATCGLTRRNGGTPARPLKKWELGLILSGKPIPSYTPRARGNDE